MTETSSDLPAKYEPRPDSHELTGTKSDSDTPRNVSKDVDYEPHPEKSMKVSPEHDAIIKSITSLYSGSCSEADMEVYAERSIYDDPLSYSDTRYKIAGQWWGLPKIFSSLRTLKTEVVQDEPNLIVYKQQHEYTLRGINKGRAVNSLISLSLDDNGKVKYHKDMWNEKDYSHEGFGKLIKKLNGDQLTRITQPPETL